MTSRHANRPPIVLAPQSTLDPDQLAMVRFGGHRVARSARDVKLEAKRATMVVHAYSRYSTAQQDVASLMRQHAAIRRYVATLGKSVRIVFIDEPGQSAASTRRPKLQKLLSDIQVGKVKHVIVEDFDRWSREVYGAVKIAQILERNDVKFHSAVDERILSKDDILAAATRSEHERLRRRNNCMAGIDALVAAGGVVQFGYGYKFSGDAGFPIVHKEHAKVIKTIAALLAAGQTPDQICDLLERRNVPSPGGTLRWERSGLIKLIKNPMLIGKPEYRQTSVVTEEDTGKRTRIRHDDPDSQRNERYRILTDQEYVAANLAIRQRSATFRAEQERGLFPPMSGPLRCDCPGVRDQRFFRRTEGKERRKILFRCNLGRACAGPTRAVKGIAVDQAIVDAVAERTVATVDPKRFEAECNRLQKEAAEERRARIKRVEAQIADRDAQANRALAKELRSGATDRLLAFQASLDRELEKLNGTLDELKEPMPDERRSLTLIRELASLKESLPLRVRSEAHAKLALAFQRMVPSGRLERMGLPFGRVRLSLDVDVKALYSPMKDPSSSDTCEVVTCMLPTPSGGADTRTALHAAEREAREGRHALTDAQWERVAPLLPDVAAGDSAGVTLRQVADAAIFCMRTAVPVSRPPAVFGPPTRVYALLKRLAYHGGIEVLVRSLEADGSDGGAELVPDRLRMQKRRNTRRDLVMLRSREAALAGTWDLTDAQWAASADCISAAVAGPFPETAVEPRRVVDAALNALRSGAPFSRLDGAYGDPTRMRAAVVRLVYTGSWASLLERWGSVHPEILEGLRVDRMLKCEVRSPSGGGA